MPTTSSPALSSIALQIVQRALERSDVGVVLCRAVKPPVDEDDDIFWPRAFGDERERLLDLITILIVKSPLLVDFDVSDWNAGAVNCRQLRTVRRVRREVFDGIVSDL